ncbi:MAG: AhpC/TSA family protein [Solobacterium sp.]|nr:AhpC/TSA family protein [Solobacterium sp.]
MRLTKGDRIPELTFSTAWENDIRLYDRLKGKTVLWVLRYIGCPVCRLDMRDIAEKYDRIREKDAQVFVVMQSDAAHLKQELDEHPVPFEIISDPDLRIYDLLDIRPAKSTAALVAKDLLRSVRKVREASRAGFTHGDYEGIETQLPALFILDETGTVLHAHYARSLADMPSAEELLALL